ncbi:MAG: hypothetical protein ABJK37_10950 [Paraglaciecola sp.]|uniref:hypothetical protein n=1 Tax=Paraglaciecola sp. TaxID=1920173 RepID=UPI0032972C87
MKILVILLTLCFSSFTLASQSPSLNAAKQWLKIIDDKYVGSWQNRENICKYLKRKIVIVAI